MKVLESSPSRYDRGIRFLTLGKINPVYNRLISYIQEGQHVLDIGCGTGALTLRAADKGAFVKGIDINPQMLEIAQKRIEKANLINTVTLTEMGVAELDSETSQHYDVIMSCLCFSELSDDEILFTLKEARRILKPWGLLLLADEVKPKNILKRIFNLFIRVPLVIFTYILTQTTTKAVQNLDQKVIDMHFEISSIKYNKLGNFVEIIAINQEEII